MRIDLFLKKVLLVEKRTDAKLMCDKNLVRLNGKYVKPSKSVNIGDIIEIESFKGTKKIRILNIPGGNVGKQDADLYYEECLGQE